MIEGTWDFRPELRMALAERVMATLRSDPRVGNVALFGSLASPAADGYPADRYSDIDIVVQVRDGSDRVFFLDVPTIVGRVAPILLRAASVEADRYIAHVWFEGYPLFWHVDVACLAGEHVEGADIADATRWERAFGLWLLATKRLRRATETIDLVRAELAERHAGRAKQRAGADELAALLETWRATATAEDRVYDRPYALGVQLLEHLFQQHLQTERC
jgi:predicted nucleotidyltransferase